jgi:hypothetical protein
MTVSVLKSRSLQRANKTHKGFTFGDRSDVLRLACLDAYGPSLAWSSHNHFSSCIVLFVPLDYVSELGSLTDCQS